MQRTKSYDTNVVCGELNKFNKLNFMNLCLSLPNSYYFSCNEYSIMNIWLLFWIFFVSFTFTNYVHTMYALCTLTKKKYMDVICNLNSMVHGLILFPVHENEKYWSKLRTFEFCMVQTGARWKKRKKRYKQ